MRKKIRDMQIIKVIQKMIQKKRLAALSNCWHNVEISGKVRLIRNKNPRWEYDESDIRVKISIYDTQVRDWFLDIAKGLKRNNESGFVILQIATGYIEGNEQYRRGESSYPRKSEDFFIAGFRRISGFGRDVSDVLLSHVYRQVRCGLFHNGMTKKDVYISTSLPNAIILRTNGVGERVIQINPHLFLDRVQRDFREYIRQLMDPNEVDARNKFKRYVDAINGS